MQREHESFLDTLCIFDLHTNHIQPPPAVGRDQHLLDTVPPGFSKENLCCLTRQTSLYDSQVVESAVRELPSTVTDEQVGFFTGLYNNDVPALVDARAVQRMLADRQAGVRKWENELGLTRSHTIAMTPLPGYDVAQWT
ncbi:hypothetical protein M404DRAFT_31499 [Pisolithus tinctorius Marx 270]|uniref:Uncharacterized protein n=1 Tax=Pisolithus tinctorius Marx 270 TaxID=870435 RepID=A0A0C3NB76_PISTI|nr:hypothetical protein M404DRAFT_31499 [Pisolithus tinctorius Marx 270]